MIRIQVLDNEYNLLNTWEDITLERFQRLCALKIPEKYGEYIKACFSEKEGIYEKALTTLSNKDLIKTFPEYFGEVIFTLSDIPREIIDRLHRIIREQLYETYFYPFVVSVFAGIPLQFEDSKLIRSPRFERDSFWFDDERNFFPQSLVYVSIEVPMYKETILTFSEASDIEVAINEWGSKGVDSVAQMIAVYCRREGEQYNPEAVLERIPKFKNLPMTIIWEVFFYITELGARSVVAMLLYSRQLEKAIQEARLMKAV
jgi:hypothetical protein